MSARRPVVRSLVMSVGALALYGTWAFLANRSHGADAAVRAGSTQGAISFTITFAITALMEALHRIAPPGRLKFLLPVVGSMLVSWTYTLGVHWWRGTPEILATALPVLAVGSLYTLSYSANLVRESTSRP